MNTNPNTKIKCGGCEKNLMQLRFSEAGKKKYFETIRLNHKSPQVQIKYPLCQNCNVGNRQELTCCMCNATKSLDCFSKAQRKKPDDAHCISCQQEKDEREPDFEDAVSELLEVERLKANPISETSTNSPKSTSSYLPSDDQDYPEDTSTNPASEDWAVGNEPPLFRLTLSSFSNRTGSSMSTSSYTSTHISSTMFESESGDSVWDGRRASAHSARLDRRGKFVKQNAVKKSLRDRAKDQLAREVKHGKSLEEQAARDESGDESDDGDDSEVDLPY